MPDDRIAAAEAFTALLEKHFADLGKRSPDMALGADATYLAAITRRARDVEDDVKATIAHAAGSLGADLLVPLSEMAEMIRFTSRRFAGTVEVDFDVVVATGHRTGLPLGELIAGATRTLA